VSVGFEAVGFEAVGFEAVGFEAVGFEAVGFEWGTQGTHVYPTRKRLPLPLLSCWFFFLFLTLEKKQ
jgi:hypothetical protein